MNTLDSNITNFPLGLKSFLNRSRVYLTILLLSLGWSSSSGRCWHVQTTDVFRSGVVCYGALGSIVGRLSIIVFSRRWVLCLPLTSWAPASVKSMLITSSKLQLGSDAWLSWPTWCNILFRTSSREAAVSSSRIVALARKPSRSRCARTSSSKFISFTYCERYWILSKSDIVLQNIYKDGNTLLKCIHFSFCRTGPKASCSFYANVSDIFLSQEILLQQAEVFICLWRLWQCIWEIKTIKHAC